MEFRHKNIRLPADRYRGAEWYFLTFCCENRRQVFRETTHCQLFLSDLRTLSSTYRIAIQAYCLMPDHVHLLAQGLDASSDLLRFLKLVKQKTGYEFKRETGIQLWQKKSYDRILRSSDSPDSVAWYIWMNPVRGGLCNVPAEYAWSGSFVGPGPSARPSAEPWNPPWKVSALRT